MFDSPEEISAQLRAGEDAFAEFKEVRLGDRSVVSPNTDDIACEMVAFANANGGVIFLGVDDSGTVCGLPEESLHEVESWLINVARNNCAPPIQPGIRKFLLADSDGIGRPVLLCEIRKSPYTHSTNKGRWYVRIGSQKRNLTGQELSRLFQQRGRSYVFDEQPVTTASQDDLDRRALETFFSTQPTIPWVDLLRNTKVLTTDEGDLDRPTVAGLLAFGKRVRDHLHSAYIEAAIYRGSERDSNDLVHSQVIEGTVADQIDEAIGFVDRFMLRPARKSLGREDFPQYALGAIYEAVVNAVAHRDYSRSGAKIRLYLFSDRLELYSPGELPDNLTLENMQSRVFTRNQLLVGFLSRMRSQRTGQAFLESRGEGVQRILRESEQLSGRRPEYRLLDGSELLLTIGAAPSPHFEAEGMPSHSQVLRLDLGRLPIAGPLLIGRETELARLDAAWEDPGTNVLTLVAFGGMGKSALVSHWLDRMAADGWRGAQRVLEWSFYSQGTEDRVTSADRFLDHALGWFGDPDPKAGAPRDRGLRLAELVRQEKTLLVLDGIEPLQHPPSFPLAGRLKDPGLAALLKGLAGANPGLCVVTSRERITDLESFPKAAPQEDLEALSPEAGAQLLKQLGVKGRDSELLAASQESGNHALTLTLLGGYLSRACGGDVRRRKEVDLAGADQRKGGHALRVIGRYAEWLGEGPELAVLRLLGLFNRPAGPKALVALRAKPAIPGLTEPLMDVGEEAW
ncbi:MAG TPA: RNA-binding domain-containing protein, partial [Thermoanaerobaculia bacterium]|nr:RNA-binding domain-containing protein [Thermoanaerobaculia bacterium]